MGALTEPLHPAQQALVDAIKAEFERAQVVLAPRMLDMIQAGHSRLADPEQQRIQAAQNVLRTCLEAVLNQMIPYSGMVPLEMALRLASYSISAAPMEDHAQMMDWLVRTLPSAHEQRMASGIRLTSEWQMHNGMTQMNFPDDS